MKFPIVWNLLNQEITTSTSLVPFYVIIPPLVAQPATLTAYFEAVCQNANASAQDLYLKMSDSPTFASSSTEKTLSITGSTSSYTRFRSTSFTLDVDNPFKAIQPNSTDLSIIAARVLVIVDTGTDPLLHVISPFGVGTYGQFDYSDTSLHNLVNPKFFKYDHSAWNSLKPKITAYVMADLENNKYSVDFEAWSFITPPTANAGLDIAVGASETPTLYSQWGVPSQSIFIDDAHLTDGYYYAFRVQQATSMRGGIFYNAYFAAEMVPGVIRQNEQGGNFADIYGGSGTEEAAGQSFTIGASGIDLRAFAICMRKSGSPTDNLTCTIYDGLSGSLVTNGTSNTVVASKVCSYGSSIIVFTFPTPPSLASLTKYYARIERSGSRDTSNYCSVAEWVTLNLHSGGALLTLASGSWSENGSGYDTPFYVISTDDSVEKFQLELPMITHNQTGTGLQDFIARFDPNEWDGVTAAAFHEQYASGSGSNTKLQEDLSGTPTDISNSSITGANFVRGGSAMAMPASADDIDTYIVTA